jgi:spermidine synthase
MEAAGFKTHPYHTYVPSFGEWGYVLASMQGYETPLSLPSGLRFLTTKNLASLFDFPVDMQRMDAEVNRLNDQVLVRYYERDWKSITR